MALADGRLFHPTYLQVAEVADLAGALALVGAFAVSWAGFARERRSERCRLLAIAGGLFAAYGAANFLSSLLELAKIAPGEPWKITAGEVAVAADELALVVAAVMVGVGIRSSRSGPVLGWACVLLAAHYGLITTAYGFDLSYAYGALFSPSARFVGYLIAGGTGYLVAAIAALKAAIAFGAGSPGRDRELGVAAILFAVGFLLAAGGLIGLLSAGSGARGWLDVGYLLMLAAAAAVGAGAFFSSEQSDGSDLSVLPYPG